MAQTATTIQGKIVDDRTDEAIPYATIQLPEVNMGTRSDIEGYFFIETSKKVTYFRIQYVGYTSQDIPIDKKQQTNLVIRLKEAGTELKTVEVRAGRRQKDKKAFDLIEEVFRRKDQNRPEGVQYYSYEAYEKLQLDLDNITDRFRNRRALRKFQFVFDNVDTNRTTNKVSLPVYLRERLFETYYRRDPSKRKEYMLGEKQVGLKGYVDEAGVSQYLNTLYQPVNIYDNNIALLATQFVGPLSSLGPAVYRYYIVDTVSYNGTRCADVFFAPRNKGDLAFMGNMLVSLDSSYAVRRVQMGISKDINLNWVSNLYIDQEFDFIRNDTAEPHLMLIKDDMSASFQLIKNENGRSLMGKKTVSYQNYKIDVPPADSVFRGPDVTAAPDRDEAFWNNRRHKSLSKTEVGIYRMVDSVQNVPAFRRAAEIANLLLVGYRGVGFFDIGPVNTFYSYNPVEGFRLRAGGRTNPKLSPNLLIETYGAYGFTDKKWKYFGGATYAFKNHKPLIFPMHQMTVSYQYDTRFPGEALQFIQDDNALLSFRRGNNTRMFYSSTLLAEYVREMRGGLRVDLRFTRIEDNPGGSLRFERQFGSDTKIETVPGIISAQIGIAIRYAPKEKIYQGKTYRIPIVSKYPIMRFEYRRGLQGFLGGQYDFHAFEMMVNKVFYVAPFGQSDWTFEGGLISGKVPYTLLEMHRANQSFSYQLPSYNLMNFMEFISDHYASVNIQHHFNGFFFNKVPLLRRLKWREVVSAKCLYGGLREENRPTKSNGLIFFPTDENNRVVMNSLEDRPYVEVSAGISNIFKLFRVDYLRRLTYTDLPGVSKWGIRARFKVDF